MGTYPQLIRDRYSSLEGNERAIDANARGGGASFVCGSFVRVLLDIDEDASVISLAAFETNGCGFMIAAADVVTKWVEGKRLADLHGLLDDELIEIVQGSLNEFPANREHCMVTVFEALRAGLAQYRIQRIEEFRGEKALICTCFGVTEDTIVEAIERESLMDIEAVAASCRAGSGCGSCRMLITELIDSR